MIDSTRRFRRLAYTGLWAGVIGLWLMTAPHPKAQASDFLEGQMGHPRVRAAFAEKEEALRRAFEAKQVRFPPRGIFLRVLKREAVVELWAADFPRGTYRRITEYKICATSGELGPKRREGDRQVPEGFYSLDRFNPASRFHLSLGLNYPNRSDRILGVKNSLGGNIFIHGKCVTIGCIPIEDEPIKELYVVALLAYANGKAKIPVHIFPLRMNEEGMRVLRASHAGNPAVLSVWEDLRAGYEYFERHRTLPQVLVNESTGRYEFK
jgi:murein L,D-transpeptidase YafK